MALATLSIDIVAKLASLEQSMSQAARVAEKGAADIASRFDGLKLAAIGIGSALASAFAGFSVVGLVKAVTEGEEALLNLAQATGSTVEKISALEDIGARTGTTFDSVGAILVKFNKALSEAKPDSDAARIIEALNLNLAQLKTLDPAEALLKVARAFEQFGQSGDKARAFQELFGKSVREAAPFLHDLAEQTDLVGKVTTETAKQAEKFNDQLASMGKDSVDTARALAGPLVEALSTLIEKLKSAAASSRAFWAEIRKRDDDEANAAAERDRAVRIEALNKLLEKGNLTVERRIRLENQLRSLQREQSGQGPEKGPIPNVAELEAQAQGKPQLVVPEAKTKGAKAALTDLQRLAEQLEKTTIAEATAGTATSEYDRALIELNRHSDEVARNPALAKFILDTAAGIDAMRLKLQEFVDVSEKTLFVRGEKAGFMAGDFRETNLNLDAMIEKSQTFRRIMAQTPTGQMNELIRQEIILRETIGDSADRAAELDEAINTLYGTLPQKAKDATDQLSTFAEEASKNIQNALGSTLRDILGGNFKSIGELWKNLVLDMIAQATAANLNELLFGKALSTGGNAGGGLLSSFFAIFTKGSAAGGMLAPGGVSRVNENGLETATVQGRDYLLNTGRDWARINRAQSSGGGWGGDVNVYIPAGVTRNEIAALVPQLKAQVKAELIQAMRRPGFSGA